MRPAALLLHACCTPEAEHASAHPDPRPRQARRDGARGQGRQARVAHGARGQGRHVRREHAQPYPGVLRADRWPRRHHVPTDDGHRLPRATQHAGWLKPWLQNGSPLAPHPQTARGATAYAASHPASPQA
eukprot:scaffold9501_cov75-Phaeocystis_antarctica.AAC.2